MSKFRPDVKSVYVIKNIETNRIKIGVASDPEKRMETLMFSGGCLMKVIYQTKPIYNYMEVEAGMHALYHEKRHIGEWFAMDHKEPIKRLKQLAVQGRVCAIVQKFEKGQNASRIASDLGVSRTGVVKYLKSKGYMKPKHATKPKKKRRVAPKPKEKPIVIAKPPLSAEDIAQMVENQKNKRKNKGK